MIKPHIKIKHRLPCDAFELPRTTLTIKIADNDYITAAYIHYKELFLTCLARDYAYGIIYDEYSRIALDGDRPN